MTERPDDTRLHDWLDETVGQPPDAVDGTQQVMSQIEETSQVGRWLPFPLRHRRPRSKTAAADTTEHLSSPIPAISGQTPTVIGRTQSMLSPAKAITAGALVFGVGVALLIAQPFGQQGAGEPGAVTDADIIPPVEVTGTSSAPQGCDGGQGYAGPYEDVGVFQSLFTCSTESGMPWSFSDPRLEGTVVRQNEQVEYFFGDPEERDACNRDDDCDTTELYIATVAFSIENERGAWRERPRFWVSEWGPSEGIVLDGEGEYEGLVAVLYTEDLHRDFWGAIIDARLLPPPPANASTR